jgi:hypothetical protein
MNWSDLLGKLKSYPPNTHQFRPPCPKSLIEAAERNMGKLPTELLEMLGHFNGAILFDSGAGGELVTLFGLFENQPISPFEWGPDWYIDKFTPEWRAAGDNRQEDWPFAMMNYGELIIFSERRQIRKWDTGQRQWVPGGLSMEQWVEEILREGDEFLNE